MSPGKSTARIGNHYGALFILILAAIFGACGPAVAQEQQQELRIALVIGNGEYQSSPLRNPTNDAEDVSRALSILGFEVNVLKNASFVEMTRAVRDFGKKIQHADAVALFFFSGHGIQYRGSNFLIPAQADIQGPEDLPYSAINLDMIYEKMEAAGARTNIIILDACRNNPFQGSERAMERGLAIVGNVHPPRSLIIYATAPGRTALDGDGRNSVFTEALLKHLGEPALDAELMVRKVRDEVIAKTHGTQVPWHNSSLSGPGFSFAGVSNENLTKNEYDLRDPAKLLEVYESEYSKLAALGESLSLVPEDVEKVKDLRKKAVAQDAEGFKGLAERLSVLEQRMLQAIAQSERLASINRRVDEHEKKKHVLQKSLADRKGWSAVCYTWSGVSALATGIVYLIGGGIASNYAGATTINEASNLGMQLRIATGVFYLSACAAGALGLSGMALGTPPKSITEQIKLIDWELEQLRAWQ
jgi:hypothetical protein